MLIMTTVSRSCAMSRIASILLTALAIALGAGAAQAADSIVRKSAPPPVHGVLTPVPDEALVVAQPVVEVAPKPYIGPPDVAYGCKRVWRCDAQVCEWRRGCHGIYGYMEGPYYSKPLAERQWERDGWPVAGTTSRTRTVGQPSPK
jgi:hypothetical protein